MGADRTANSQKIHRGTEGLVMVQITCFHTFKGEDAERIEKILAYTTKYEKENIFRPDPKKLKQLTYLRKALAIKQLYPGKTFKRRGDRFIDETGNEYVVKRACEGDTVIVDDNYFTVFKHL